MLVAARACSRLELVLRDHHGCLAIIHLFLFTAPCRLSPRTALLNAPVVTSRTLVLDADGRPCSLPFFEPGITAMPTLR